MVGTAHRRAAEGSRMDRVLTPYRVRGLVLRNRMVVPPITTRLSGADGSVSAREVAFWAERARGGAGLVIAGPFVAAGPASGLLRVDADRYLPGITALVEAIHAGGAAAGAQLTVGAAADRQPSAAELATVVAEGAARLVEAGADLLDLDVRAGGVLAALVTAGSGEPADRARELRAVVAAVRAAAGDTPLSVRLSLDQHLPQGRDLADSVALAAILADAGADLLSVEEGSPEAPFLAAPDYHQPLGAHLAAAATVRRRTGVPVLVAGATPVSVAARAIAAGVVDLVGLGRATVADPLLPALVAAGAAHRARPCVRGNACLDAVRSGRPLRCAVNPLAGQETALALRRAARPRRVVVVGGGPAGLEAARVAASRGHAVDLYEARDALGGVLVRAASPAFKRELLDLVGWYAQALAELGVTVHLCRTVRAGSGVLHDADVVVLATGARPIRPEITGLDRPEVLDVLDLHRAALGTRVVVIGGGTSGADAALDLADRGHRVSLVEAGDEVAPGAPPVGRAALLTGLAERGVPVLTGTLVHAIDDVGVHGHGPDGVVTLPADSVVLAVGVLPSRELAGGGVLEDPRVHLVGDCLVPGTLGDAVRAGFDVGRLL